ncbi:succinate dehydrogenase assembly factor, putative [Babesia ovis]|uniref:Succinate dehydrogenase assembly factor, putative n=1 Tax=Babesia ovis TaxID=5869 RepID=A0A9W5TB67_BABOV|nr:succinate dehydrogenase assembly factor, putative [Babesia ovis]
MFSGGIKDDTLHSSQRRLIMRVKNTGMKELDVLFAGFMASIGEHMDARMLGQFHTMLDLDTPTLYRTFIVQQQLPEQLLDNLVAAKVLEYARSGSLAGV